MLFAISRVIRLGCVVLEASDRSVAHTQDLVLLGTLSHCGGYQEAPFPKASVPFYGAGFF